MKLLQNTLRSYAWGSVSAMAELFGYEHTGKPEAELWIGAHADSPSLALTGSGERVRLDALIASDPQRILGEEVARRFDGRLPYLMKVLAAGSPLSLQVHPNISQATAGYSDENARGVPRNAGHRNYKDSNHKPEMIFALSRFEALCGFRPVDEAAVTFAELAGLLPTGSPEARLLTTIAADLLGNGRPSAHTNSGDPDGPQGPTPVEDGLRAGFSRLFSEPELVSRIIESVARMRVPESQISGELRTVADLHSHYPGDPGALVALLLNRVVLQPGESLYLPAGNIHAYLSGLGIEVMASSDNVLRGGLTPKHVDVAELLKTIVFNSISPPLLTATYTPSGQEMYRPPFEEFQLQRIELSAPEVEESPGTDDKVHTSPTSHAPLIQNGPTLVLAVQGKVSLRSHKGTLQLNRGESAFIPADEGPVIVQTERHEGAGAGALAFAVTVGARVSGAATASKDNT